MVLLVCEELLVILLVKWKYASEECGVQSVGKNGMTMMQL